MQAGHVINPNHVRVSSISNKTIARLLVKMDPKMERCQG
jgi:hypothetical protein